MRFMAMVYFGPEGAAGMTPEDFRQLDDATIEHDRKLRESGHLIYASPLAGMETARSLRNVDGELVLTDGPFIESKEMVGGFLLLEGESMDELIPLFADAPILRHGRMEIRPLVVHTHSETGEGRPDFKLD